MHQNVDSEEDEDYRDPNFCVFCQDRIPEGRMLVVQRPLQHVLADTETRACAYCGVNFTDRPVIQNPETGDVGVLQFEHDDYDEERLKDRIESLSEVLENVPCHVCDEAQDSENSIPPREFVIKLLRIDPTTNTIRVTCGKCAALGICPCCNGEDVD